MTEKIIISLTSYPERIKDIDIVLESLCHQTCSADKIVLYLSKLQFKDKRIEQDYMKYKKFGFEIHWCSDDIGSHKKYYYAMQEFPDDVIITVDDDFMYSRNLVRELMQHYKKFPNAILARRANLITKAADGNAAPYSTWWSLCGKYVGVPRMDLFATTGGGTLFPPRIFPEMCFRKTEMMKVCPHADDIWIKILQLINNVPTVLVREVFEEPPIEKYVANGLHIKFNRDGGNDRQWNDTMSFWKDQGINLQMLTDRLFRDGAVKAQELKEVMYEEYLRNIEIFMQNVKPFKEIKIYGAGTVAKRTYSILRILDMHRNISGFLVKDKSKNDKELFGFPIEEIEFACNEMKYNGAIIIALNDVETQKKVQNGLLKKGILSDRIFLMNRSVLRAFWELERLINEKDKLSLGEGKTSGN